MGRGVVEQRSHCCCAALTAPAQRRIGEIPHNGAASRATTARLSIYLCEEVIWKGNHYLCHAISIPRYTGYLVGQGLGKVPHRSQPIST